MATCKDCKDCLHYKLCGVFGYVSPAKFCGFYTDRSKFVELPCKVGDKVFYFDTDERIYVQTVESLIYGLTKTGFVINSEVDFISDLLGKRFFLSYEEAERALKERENSV